MKMTIRKLTTLFLVITANAVCAQEPPSTFYGEVGQLPLVVRFSDASKVTPKLVRSLIGINITENFAVEGVLGVTLNKDEDVTATMAGTFLKSHLAINEDVTFFGRLGVNRTMLGGVANGSITRTAYGIGLQTQFTRDFYGQFDYMIYGKSPNSESVRGATFSIGTRF